MMEDIGQKRFHLYRYIGNAWDTEWIIAGDKTDNKDILKVKRYAEL